MTSQRVFPCGPIAVAIETESRVLARRMHEALAIYATDFAAGSAPEHVLVRLVATDREAAEAPSAAGDFLHCARMRVDATASGLVARCQSGATAVHRADRGAWELSVPLSVPHALDDLDDLVSLILTQGWRATGWVPIHAAAIARGGRCVLVCAPSGGGKSTLTVALVRAGWSTLGDDKLLMRIAGRVPAIVALSGILNLDPALAGWFPELSVLRELPAHSVWTHKRRIAIGELWPGRLVERARPVAIVRLERRPGSQGVRIAALAASDVLSLLLHQTVVPGDRVEAGRILSTIALAARGLRGLAVELGDDVFAGAGGLEPLERALDDVA